MSKWTQAEMKRLDDRWRGGEPLRAIAADAGVSVERVRQLIHKSRRLELRDWKLANGWRIERPGGMWIDPPGPWPQYPGPIPGGAKNPTRSNAGSTG